MKSLYLVGIPGMYERIVEGVNIPLEECEKINGNRYTQHYMEEK